jgi:hypothetical protein
VETRKISAPTLQLQAQDVKKKKLAVRISD